MRATARQETREPDKTEAKQSDTQNADKHADRQTRQSAALTLPPARVELRTATDTALNTSS